MKKSKYYIIEWLLRRALVDESSSALDKLKYRISENMAPLNKEEKEVAQKVLTTFELLSKEEKQLKNYYYYRNKLIKAQFKPQNLQLTKSESDDYLVQLHKFNISKAQKNIGNSRALLDDLIKNNLIFEASKRKESVIKLLPLSKKQDESLLKLLNLKNKQAPLELPKLEA